MIREDDFVLDVVQAALQEGSSCSAITTHGREKSLPDLLRCLEFDLARGWMKPKAPHEE
jgi:hypothetical protein